MSAVKILKPLGKPSTLLCEVYGSSTNAMSMLCCIIIWVRFVVATQECCRFTCRHLSVIFLFKALVWLQWPLPVYWWHAIVSSRCSVCILLTLLACSGSFYREMSGSPLFFPICCTNYMLYNWCICVAQTGPCIPSTCVFQHTRGRVLRPCNLYACG